MNNIRVTPQEAAVYANLGIKATRAALQERFGLEEPPEMSDICSMLGTSIAVAPTSGLNFDELLALAQGSEAQEEAAVRQRFEENAAGLWPHDLSRQDHWVEACVANYRIDQHREETP